jgi:hypothetical protein
MKNLITLFLCTWCILSTNAQEKGKASVKHNIGAFTSIGSGKGLSYRYLPGKFGFQITTLPVFDRNGGYNINIGANLVYILQQRKYVELYGFLGNELVHSFVKTYNGTFPPNQKYTGYAANLGLGLKFDLLEVLNLNIQAGYGAFEINNSPNTNISLGIGLYYHW